MPIPAAALMLALLLMLTLPATADVGVPVVPPRKPTTIPAGSLPEVLGVLPELMVPAVDTEIELLSAGGTEDPWFSARIPLLAELMVAPGSVLTSRTPKVDIARIPY